MHAMLLSAATARRLVAEVRDDGAPFDVQMAALVGDRAFASYPLVAIQSYQPSSKDPSLVMKWHKFFGSMWWWNRCEEWSLLHTEHRCFLLDTMRRWLE